MLKDLNYDTIEVCDIFAILAQINGVDISKPNEYFERYETGVYRHDGYKFNGDYFINLNCKNKLVNEYPRRGKMCSYGVCDNYKQILDKFKDELNDKDVNYCIIISTVKKSDEPEFGGWRWCKWGKYIGDKEPKCEYLYDEKDIDVVYCFHIYEIE